MAHKLHAGNLFLREREKKKKEEIPFSMPCVTAKIHFRSFLFVLTAPLSVHSLNHFEHQTVWQKKKQQSDVRCGNIHLKRADATIVNRSTKATERFSRSRSLLH